MRTFPYSTKLCVVRYIRLFRYDRQCTGTRQRPLEQFWPRGYSISKWRAQGKKGDENSLVHPYRPPKSGWMDGMDWRRSNQVWYETSAEVRTNQIGKSSTKKAKRRIADRTPPPHHSYSISYLLYCQKKMKEPHSRAQSLLLSRRLRGYLSIDEYLYCMLFCSDEQYVGDHTGRRSGRLVPCT